MLNEALVFLHAAHQVRQAFDGLQLVSWLAIGIGVGALVLSWGRLVAWIREPEQRPPAVKLWGEDDNGLYFELERGGGETWFAETPDGGRVMLAPDRAATGLLRPVAPLQGRPAHVVSAEGVRLRL